MRPLLALLAWGPRGRTGPAPASGEYVLAVEFPYYLYPRTLWERELVWLKNTGVETVESPFRGTGTRFRRGNTT